MAILFLAPTLPSPLTGGGSLRMYHLVRFLGERFEVDLVTPHRDEPETEVERLRPYCRHIDRIPASPGAGRRRLLRLGPYAVDPGLTRAVRERLDNGDHVAIQAEKAAMLPHVPRESDLPLVLDIWAYGLVGPRRELRRQRGLGARARSLLQLARFAFFDAFCWPETHKVLVVSEFDRQRCAAQRPGRDLLLVPNGVDCQAFTPGATPDSGPPRLVFTGDMGFSPNVEAAEVLARRIFPIVRQSHPDIELALVGRRPGARVQALEGDGVIVTGEVPEMQPWLRDASVYVAPMKTGAGTCTKILEALAVGLPVVTNPLGMEGIEATHGENALVLETDEEIAAEVTDLLHDAGRRRRLGQAARRLVEERYDWPRCLAPLEPLYRALHGKATPGRRAP